MSKKLSIITLITFIIGIIIGLISPTFATNISFLGTIYINLLKLIMIPVLFTAIVNSLLNNKINTKSITIKTILLFIIMFLASFLICCGLWQFIKPGNNFVFEEVVWEGTPAAINIGDFFINLFPTNILQAMSNNAILPVIIFAFVFGIIGQLLQKANYKAYENLVALNSGLTFIFEKMLKYIMYITPIGVLSLMANTTALFGLQVLNATLIYVGCAYLGCIIIAILIMILPVWIYCKINPIEYIKKVYKVWLITLSTCSSAATLPNTIKVCNEEFGVPENITNIVVPLGCTIHMCGGAVSFSLLAMLNMQMFNIPMTAGLFITMIVVALLLNMGAPGIPGGGIAIGATYLSTLGLPLIFIGFYAGIYRLLDIAYTTMNVTGDITANLIINKYYNNKVDPKSINEDTCPKCGLALSSSILFKNNKPAIRLRVCDRCGYKIEENIKEEK